MDALDRVRALTFDAFGTILDLGGSLTPYLAEFLRAKGSDLPPSEAWPRYRYRQRIEQYQDNLLMLGHHGYLDSARRALTYGLRGAYVHRYGLPYEETPFQPDLVVRDFTELAERLGT